MKDDKELSRLTSSAKNGSDEAFAEIYNRFSKHVYYNAIRLVGNEDEAKDILQEVMLHLYNHLDDIKNPKSMPLYLYRTTYNICVDTWRQNNKTNLFENDETAETLYGAEKRLEFLPAEYAESKELRNYIVKLMDELQPSHRAVLLLYYYNGLTIKEIANVLNTSTNAVRVRLQRSRGALKRKLEKDKKKEMVSMLSAAPVPVLTQVLQSNADDLFTSDLQIQTWQNIAETLGLRAAGTAIVTAAAASGTSAGVAIAASAGSKIMAVILTVGITSVAALGTVYIASTETPLGSLATFSHTTSDINSGSPAGEDIDDPEPFPGVIPQDSSGQPFSPDSPVSPHTSQGSAEVPSSADMSGNDVSDSSTSKASKQLISAADTLRYPQGTALSLERIYIDASISGAGLDELSIWGLDEIDTNFLDQYGILIALTGNENQTDYSLAIIIIIE